MKRLLPLLAMGMTACLAPGEPTGEPADPTEIQAPENGVTDSFRYDIPDGLPNFLQGKWKVVGASDTGQPYYFFEGNRVGLFNIENGKSVQTGSDNFRPVDNCVDLNYDPMGRGVQLGRGVFGDLPVCWTLRAISSDTLNLEVMSEILTVIRIDADPGQTMGVSPTISGRWVSKDNPNTHLLFEGKFLTEIHANENIGKSEFEILDNCSDRTSVAEGVKSANAVLYSKNGLDVCYMITELTKNRLTLTKEGRGNFLIYERAK